MRAIQFIKATVKMATMATAMVVFTISARAANITWNTPAIISSDADVVTIGTLDRAYNMGTTGKVAVVNGVAFLPFGTNAMVDEFSDGRTTVAISGDGDGLIADAINLGSGQTGLSPNYRAILQSGLLNRGSALALTLNNLTVGKTYLVQSWSHNSKNIPWKETLTGGASTSTAIKYNSTGTFDGLGQYIVGAFTADHTSQIITYTPDGGPAQINAFQLRTLFDSPSVLILKHPLSVTNFPTKSVRLSVFAHGSPPLTYQWQKITRTGTNNMVDGSGIFGATSNILSIDMLTTDDVGGYRVVVKDTASLVTSRVATVQIQPPATNQLINVAISDGAPTVYQGIGVLEGTPSDIWNSLDARIDFTNAPLVDSAGMTTAVSLTLARTPIKGWISGASRNSLLGGVSFAAGQSVTLSHLEPNSLYDLVVFSAGNSENEGGVFSGSISGISHGYSAPEKAPGGFISGTNFVENPFALSDQQGMIKFTIAATATILPNGFRHCGFNGLQLKKMPDGRRPPVILEQPLSLTSYAGHPATLAVNSATAPAVALAYQWQKVTAASTNNLADENGISGSSTSVLSFNPLTPQHIGAYQVVITNAFGSITSKTASIIIPTNQMINVAINDGATAPFKGVAILAGHTNDIWNSPDGRSGFSNIALVDSTGAATPVTLSLVKPPPAVALSGAVRNSLLGGVSFAVGQTVTLSNLEPNTLFDLVVFSVGNVANEGGVFSGAITGISCGYPANDVNATNFIYGTNYIENPFALSDAQGTLTFTIAPTASVFPNGFRNCDFNGLQLKKLPAGNFPPVIVQQPATIRAYLQHPLSLSVGAASPPALPLSYQWLKITATKTNCLVDGDNISGSTSNRLFFKALSMEDAGNYQVVASNSAGSETSSVATVITLKNQLINVSVNDGFTPAYQGLAVLEGAADDVWNNPDGRSSFKDTILFDSKGIRTPVSLTLSKTDGWAVRNSLLGAVSYATGQTVTLKHLLPNNPYDLIVFSVGNMANEGGVFSGDITGIAHGYPVNDVVARSFISGTNYVRNPHALSDASGTLTINILPTATAVRGGFINCDFNGLQLMELLPDEKDNKSLKTR